MRKPLIKFHKKPILFGFGENLLKTLNKELIEYNKMKTSKNKQDHFEKKIINPLLEAIAKDIKSGDINKYIAFNLNRYRYPIRYIITRFEIIVIMACIFMVGFLMGVLY